MFLDIVILWFVLYYTLRIIRNNSRTIQIFKGIFLVVLIDALAKFLGLKTVQYFADIFLNWGFLALIIVFQPEIRSLLERLGKSNVFSRITTLTGNEREKLVDHIVTAVMLLSKDQTGALISIEQSHSLEDFIQTGTRLNSDVTAELLTSLFVTTTPLHDGAVIIQGDKIACASAYFPPTNMDLPSRFGARHRAAIGISEISDCVTIVVSEETGGVSIAEGGKIFAVDRKQLHDYLMRVICGESTEVHGQSQGESFDPRERSSIVITDAASKQRPAARTYPQDQIAINKQTTKEVTKVEIEEIRPAGESQTVVPKKTPQEPQPAEKKPAAEKGRTRKRKMSLFQQDDSKSKESAEASKMKELDEEAASIKLPNKKKRATPSYPRQQTTPLKDQLSYHTESQGTSRTAKKASPRMTSAEVRALREANTRRLKAEKPASQGSKNAILNDDKFEEDSILYDTSKIDISKIVGFKDELSETFQMVDDLPVDESASDFGNGGDR